MIKMKNEDALAKISFSNLLIHPFALNNTRNIIKGMLTDIFLLKR